MIQNRHLWKDQTEQMLPGHDGTSNIVYDEVGTVHCYDCTSQPIVRHPMAYIGHEPQRETLKYRCPARHEGWTCPHDEACNAGKTYGKTVRVKQTIDLRRFPPIPRATKKFERLYNGRTSVERVNARLKIFWGVDDGNITGSRRFHALIGVVMIVHAGFAKLLAGSAPRRDLGQVAVGTDPEGTAGNAGEIPDSSSKDVCTTTFRSTSAWCILPLSPDNPHPFSPLIPHQQAHPFSHLGRYPTSPTSQTALFSPGCRIRVGLVHEQA